MERLTRKSNTSNMVWFIDREHKNGYAEREPCEMDAHHARLAIAKLAEYEDLEEQGKLLKVPCAVGDTVYNIYPNDLEDNILEKTIVGFSDKAMMLYGNLFWTSFDEIGKTIFFTKEEAETALKES